MFNTFQMNTQYVFKDLPTRIALKPVFLLVPFDLNLSTSLFSLEVREKDAGTFDPHNQT